MPNFPSFKGIKKIVKNAMTEQGYTDTRAPKLDEIEEIETPTEGIADFLTTDTYPKTVTVITKEIGTPFYLEGLIDLSELLDTEAIDVSMSAKVKSAGSYVLYTREGYADAQDEPLLKVATIESNHGLKVEMIMDLAPAADRHFDYIFFVKKKTT